MTAGHQAGTSSTATQVVIDASNIHQGGALQSAASVVDEITHILRQGELRDRYPWLEWLRIVMSPEVAAEMGREPLQHEVVSRRWHSPALWHRRGPLPDVYVTIFGPAYGVRRGRVAISGFADGTAILRDPTLSDQTLKRRLRRRIRTRASRFFFARQDLLYTEAERTATELSRSLRFDATRVGVIPNTPNGVLSQPALWRPAPLPAKEPGTFDVGFVTRWYPHKNFEILGSAAQLLQENGIRVRFIVSLRPDELERLDPATRAFVYSVGELSIRQVPSVYEYCDAMVFPSLIESASAAPLESLRLNGHLAASDRDFVRIPCGDAPHYFEPTDPRACAEALAEILTNENVRTQRAEAARVIAGTFPSPRTRAEDFLQFVDRGTRGEP
ncbi:glycosyltransferase [Demetria terragena]|uniref:glycosyltransferase n=1 Tax=Demetria terragena TaxID=63959 RepID=UPI00038276EF|nr:glycosyltransferase [Demetria terragena]